MNKSLLIVTLVYLVINFLFFKNAESLQGGKSMIYIVIFPVFWIITLIVVGILAFKNRKKWFKKDLRISTIILLILCTPLSVLFFSYLVKPKMYLSGTGYNPKNGITIKTEVWDYSPGQTAVIKYWKLNTENYYNDNQFKKDSIWVYFHKNGDTLKIEKYKNDELIESKDIKK
jgi:amino acid transporter